MKRKCACLTLYFFSCVALFALVLRPLFVFLNRHLVHDASLPQFAECYLHGLPFDLAAAGILSIPPFFFTLLSACRTRFPLRKVLRCHHFVIAVIISLVIVADTVLYGYWHCKLDRTVLAYLESPEQVLANVTTTTLAMTTGLFLLVALVVLLVLVQSTRMLETRQKQEQGRRRGAWLLGLMGLLLFFSIRGPYRHPISPRDAYYCDDVMMNHTALNPLYHFTYSLLKHHDELDDFYYFDQETCNHIIDSLFPRNGDTTLQLLSTPRPNILIIVMEGFTSKYVKALGGEDVAREISQLTEEGVVFTQCYCSGHRTDRGLMAILNGYVGQPTTSLLRRTNKVKKLPSLPKTLKDHGYHTHFLYGGDIDFFRMREYALASGHDGTTSREDFPANERTSKWGVPDHLTANRLYEDIMARQAEQDSLWYITYLTLSSHTPFDVPEKLLEDKERNAFAYSDKAIGWLVKRLKASPAWEKLLVVLVADHTCDSFEKAKTDFPFIPLVLTGGAIKEPRHIDLLVSQSDIAATLLGQMGITHDSFTYSRDVTATTYTHPFAFNTFDNGFNYRDSTGCTVFDNIADRAVIGSDTLRERNGKAILQHLYNEMRKR